MRQMLDGQTQPARAGGSDHQPVPVAGKGLVIEGLGKLLVVDLVVIPLNPLFRHAGRSPRFKNMKGATKVGAGNPLFVRERAEQFAIEVREAEEVVERLDLQGGIPVCFLGPVQPVRAAGLGGEMPLGHGLNMSIECCAGLVNNGLRQVVGGHGGHSGIRFNRLSGQRIFRW